LDHSYKLNNSTRSPDQNWDDFLFHIPGDHYTQSSLWAIVNEAIGWQVIRVTVLKDRKIIAGVQMLIKKTASFVVIGYIIKGPVFGLDEPRLIKDLFCELSRIARQNQVCFIALQPPNSATWLNLLSELGFRPSNIKMEPIATILLDLNLDQDSLLAQMKARTRYNIHLSTTKGINVREGSVQDLDTFYNLLISTSQRQQFQIYPKQFFNSMWETLNPCGHIKLFLSEYEGIVISAQVILLFGDTAVNKMIAWSGQHAKLKPNEALMWYSIIWCKRHGYRYFNLEGIEQDASFAVLNKKPVPATLKFSVTSFKLGFGGRVVTLPGVYENIYSKALRKFYENALNRAEIINFNETL